MFGPVVYFGALFVAAVAAIQGVGEYLLSRCSNRPVFPEVRKQLLLGSACFADPDAQWYTFLPGWLNHVACTITTLFIAIYRSPNVGPMLGLFASVFVPATFIVTYDSFRPATRAKGAALSRLGSVFLLLAQFVTAGVSLPLYYTLYLLSTGGAPTGRPRPEYIWTALLSMVLGMLVPSLVMDTAQWSYASVAAWQAFPVFMLVLNLVLPKLLRKVIKPSSRPVAPVLIAAFVCTVVSIREHHGLVFGPSPIADSLLPAFKGRDRGQAGHALFAVDLAFAGVTMASIIALALRASSAPMGLFSSATLLLVGTVVLGPGAATMLAWAWVELAPQAPPIRDST